MNACCNALARLLCDGIKQRQRFSRLLNCFHGLRHVGVLIRDTVVLLDEHLILEIVVLYELNGSCNALAAVLHS